MLRSEPTPSSALNDQPARSILCGSNRITGKNMFILNRLERHENVIAIENPNGVFLDMFKAFDRVWHEGLRFLFKLKCYGVDVIL